MLKDKPSRPAVGLFDQIAVHFGRALHCELETFLTTFIKIIGMAQRLAGIREAPLRDGDLILPSRQICLVTRKNAPIGSHRHGPKLNICIGRDPVARCDDGWLFGKGILIRGHLSIRHFLPGLHRRAQCRPGRDRVTVVSP